MKAKAVLNTPSAIKDIAELREILDGHCAIATGAQNTVVIASAIVWSAYDVYVVTLQYVTSTTITTIASTMAPLDDITFPSVYICNVNQVFHFCQIRLSMHISMLIECVLFVIVFLPFLA